MRAVFVSPAASGRDGVRLALLAAAAMLPVLVGCAVTSVVPVVVSYVLASTVGVCWTWGRRQSWRRGDLVAVAGLAAVAAFSQPWLAAWSLVGGWCGVALLASQGRTVPWWLPQRRRGATAALVVALGLILGAINVELARVSGQASGGSLSWGQGLLDALRAGIVEEVGIRLPLLALCLAVVGGWPRRRRHQALAYAVLTVPHAAMHFVTAPSQLVSGTVVLAVVFGLPLSWLLRHRGVAAAVTAHALIDAIRFLVLAS